MIEEGYAEAFATKALCYQLEWDRTVDAAKKKILASQIQQSLRQGIKRHDPWSAYILADLWWLGRVLRKDPEKAKELWLQATEWDTRKPNKGLDKFANAVVPRFVRAPWKANPDADAQMCLKYTLETDGVVPRSNCRLGLFYYLRPDMSREEHVRVWTTEPDNTKAAELFIKAINGRFFQAKVFLAEMLLWNRVTVLQTADGLAVQHARSSGEAAGMDGSGEADSQSLPSNTTSTTPATSLESSAESDDDGKTASSPRREQLTLVRTLLSDLVRWPREYVTAQRLDRLAERLLKNVDSGSGDVLPTERDLRFLRSRDRASPSPVKAAKRTEGPVEPKPVTKEVEHVELALA
ncbi:hypothetical protein CALVIDRAFT_538529 [Calocera viscosa TUFC12733]|uniref:Uncharacterized protein n=1 Tax=Calocera viscosa (strain TUFC12733) TaxID=1330018 RepID=A0A167KVW0_CALVF|nr:hypothetical protein CALVIDRAFT_538529 [Calocera viscosa TUFC12733]